MSNLHRPILIYSPSTFGKTCFVGLLVRALLDKLGKGKARLYTVESYDSIEDVISDGLIEVWKFNNRDYPFETSHFAVDGYWPLNPDDPLSRLAPPGPLWFEDYPIRVYEGTATIANYIAGNAVKGGMARRIGEGESIGPTDSGEAVRLMDGSIGVGGLSRSNYGFIQKEMIALIQRSQACPGYVIWTAQEDDVKEKKAGVATGRTVTGPEVFGGALTNVIAREFSNAWRIAVVGHDFQEGESTRRVLERRLYLKAHLDPTDSMLIAVGRNSAGLQKQGEIPDFVRLTDSERLGQPRLDAAKIVIEKLGL